MVMVAQEWLIRLHENGHLLTPARRAVVETMASSRRAITPLQVYDAARKRHPGLGVASVYRTLEMLEQLGLVQRVHRPEGCEAFVAAGEGHRHLLVCERCGRVAYFEGDHLQPLIGSISRRSGYRIGEHWLQLFGLCHDCQNQVRRK